MATFGLCKENRGQGFERLLQIFRFLSPLLHEIKRGATRFPPRLGAAALRSSELPGPCVRWDWLGHLSAAEAVTQYRWAPEPEWWWFQGFRMAGECLSVLSWESCLPLGRERHCYPPTLPAQDNRVTLIRSPLDRQEVSFITPSTSLPPPAPSSQK